MSYFPMFIELEGQKCLVVGGGQIALHKVKVLMDFGAKITVAAEDILPEIRQLAGVECLEECFRSKMLEGHTLVVAATDDKEENRRISILCRKENIPVNVVDQTEDCSFIFPAYLKEGEVVAAFSSGGQSPVVTQYLKEQVRPVLTELLGKLAAQLGHLRQRIKQTVPGEERKAAYQTLLRRGLIQNRLLTEDEINAVLGGNPGTISKNSI